LPRARGVAARLLMTGMARAKRVAARLIMTKVTKFRTSPRKPVP
jgi:hypothetical protein